MNIPPSIIRDAPIKLIMSGITPKRARSKIMTKTSVEQKKGAIKVVSVPFIAFKKKNYPKIIAPPIGTSSINWIANILQINQCFVNLYD